MGDIATRGILNPIAGLAHFQLERQPAPTDLAWCISNFWSVRWDLEGRPDYESEVLPYPCVNVSFQDGRFEVHGPGTQRFVAKLTGRGQVTGTRFSPAGFAPFAGVPMRSLVDRVLRLEEVTGRPAPQTSGDSAAVREAVADFLRGFAAVRGEEHALVDRLVALVQHDRQISRSEQLAEHAGVSVRTLHRLFERCVGVGPKWVVRRSRVQDAAERVARGERIDWASTAHDLGYHDQAHLIHDFRAQTGFTPAAYARRCRGSIAEAEAERAAAEE